MLYLYIIWLSHSGRCWRYFPILQDLRVISSLPVYPTQPITSDPAIIQVIIWTLGDTWWYPCDISDSVVMWILAFFAVSLSSVTYNIFKPAWCCCCYWTFFICFFYVQSASGPTGDNSSRWASRPTCWVTGPISTFFKCNWWWACNANGLVWILSPTKWTSTLAYIRGICSLYMFHADFLGCSISAYLT